MIRNKFTFYFRLGILFFLCLSYEFILAQDVKKAKISKSKSFTDELEYALQSGDNKRIALAYENLAQKFEKINDLENSESHYQKSLKYYTVEKDKKNIARVSRILAIIQEQLNKKNEAAQNYRRSADYSINDKEIEINKKDELRVQPTSSSQEQKSAIESKIEIINNTPLKNKEDSLELARSYEQLGDMSVANANYEDAAIQYNTVSQVSRTLSSKIQNKLNSNLLNITNADSAIMIALDYYYSTDSLNLKNESILTSINLANLYKKEKKIKEEYKWRMNAYTLAKEHNNLQLYTQALDSLSKYFMRHNEKDSVILYNSDFIAHYNSILLADSSFFDKKLLTEASEKILQLEREQKLQDELVKSKSQFNNFLLFMLITLCVAIAFLFKTLKSIQKQNKQIALQSLRREMNPHFIFNSLNSVNQYISTGNEREANNFLSKFSILMRRMMENSNHDFIDLEEEIEFIKSYLELECKRFNNTFTFSIQIEDTVNLQEHIIPAMILQPLIENSIWHGIRYLDAGGNIKIKISYINSNIVIHLEDNGIGITKSKELKTNHQKHSKARGSSNVTERINLLNQLHKINISLLSEEKSNKNSTGMIHILRFPKTINLK